MLVTTYQKQQRLNNDQFDLKYNNEYLNMILTDAKTSCFLDIKYHIQPY